MAKRLTEVHIGGVDVTSLLLEWTKSTSYGDELTFSSLEFPKTINSLVSLNNTLTLEIWEGYSTPTDTKIFDGFIESFVPDGYKTIVRGRDKLADLVRKEVTQAYDKSVPGDALYPDGKISDLALDIITTYGGLNADGTTIQDSGTEITLSKFPCNHADPLERLKKLADTLGWVLYYRADTDKVYFEPRGFTTNSNILTVGTNIIGIPKWIYSKDQMINDLTLEGAVQVEPREETFSGDGSTTSFTLSSVEAPTKIDVYLSATKNYSTTDSIVETEHQVGVPDGTTVGTFDFTFDLKNKNFDFTSTTPPTGTNNIYSRSNIETPNPIHRIDGVSINTYGRYQKTIPLSDVLNVDDAEKRSQKIIEKYSQPFTSAKLRVNVTDSTFRVGQQVRVIDNVSSPTVNKFLVITKITKKWPGNFDEFEVGDKEWLPVEWQVNVMERVKRLEETLLGDTAIINEFVDQKIEFDIVPEEQEVLVEMINDSFIVGIDPNDIIYDADEALALNNFVDVGDWSDSGITTAKTTASTTQGTSGDYLTSTAAIQFVTTEGGLVSLKSTTAWGDISNAVGTNSGTPANGTFGLWLRTTQTGNFTTTTLLNVGSDDSNYVTYSAQTYKQKVAIGSGDWELQSGWTYLLFDANSPDSQTGTPVWTSSSGYVEIKSTVSDATTFNLDYNTVSKNDIIGLNGLDERYTQLSQTITTF